MKRQKRKRKKCNKETLAINAEYSRNLGDGAAPETLQGIVEENTTDAENRRSTRLGAAIAIIAVVGTICMVVFNLALNAVNVWPNSGVAFWLLQVMMLLTMSTVLLISCDLIAFVINDLRRYNVIDKNYKQFDEKSDSSYNSLLDNFKIYINMLAYVVIAICYLLSMFEENKTKIVLIIILFFLIVISIYLVVDYIKKNRQSIRMLLIKIMKKIAIWILCALVCYLILATYLLNSKALLKIDYQKDGKVEICNASSREFKGLEITICDNQDKTLFKDNIKEERLLEAKEEKYISKEVDGKSVAGGVLLNHEMLHWKYILYLNDVIKDSGQYKILIKVKQKEKCAELINMFMSEDGSYTYAINNLEKEY